ncbi:hypothetical protein MCHLDSM_00268 [Mycolicibacterium chlorophenolicum]|uniref:Uncharacterized protein n=1 Tax=Mycolicibacterium chlorophenolicum TaxID=37916 RepID=A0A0J6WNX5_9MYCO|nr:hypothetical protein MCHLDSM_00268 [Mycolicibacterium chlorophenolicum]
MVSRIATSTLKFLAVIVDTALNLAIPPEYPMHRVAAPEESWSQNV